MISRLMRTLDNLVGRGEAAVTVPPLDGALRPNRALDEATTRVPLADVDCLAVVSGELLASAGNVLFSLDAGGTWVKKDAYTAEITCISAVGNDGLAAALVTGEIHLVGGGFDGKTYRVADDVNCITALASDGTVLYVANGSAENGPDDWQRDLLQGNVSGSVWRINLETGQSTRLVDGLAYPAGLAIHGEILVCSEAWKHRLIHISLTRPGDVEVLHAGLPGYPGRLVSGADGPWLSAFAPRSQLVEFVLREPSYKARMMAEVPKLSWIAPTLRSGKSFYEPLQGGSVKHLGMLKPWAPTLSAGLCIRLDAAFQPHTSLHSRADGETHGVTSVAEHQGQLFVAARGDGTVVAIGLDDLGDEQ